MAPGGPRAGLYLWWKTHLPVNGFITRHLSPFESKVMEPLGKDFKKKTWARFDDNKASAIPAFFALVGIIKYSDWKNDQVHRSHRP